MIMKFLAGLLRFFKKRGYTKAKPISEAENDLAQASLEEADEIEKDLAENDLKEPLLNELVKDTNEAPPVKKGAKKGGKRAGVSRYIKAILAILVIVILAISSFAVWRIIYVPGQKISESQDDAEEYDTRSILTNADIALFQAVRDGDAENVLRSLREGGRANAFGDFGVTPLRAAIIRNRSDMVGKLFEAGLNAADDINSDLVYAIVHNRPQAVKELARLSSNVNAFDHNGYTPLQYAIRRNHVAVARELLNAGADVNARGEDGTSPLIMAVKVGRPDMVRELLNAGADIGVLSPSGDTAMSIAQGRRQQIIIAILAEAEASASLNNTNTGDEDE